MGAGSVDDRRLTGIALDSPSVTLGASTTAIAWTRTARRSWHPVSPTETHRTARLHTAEGVWVLFHPLGTTPDQEEF